MVWFQSTCVHILLTIGIKICIDWSKLLKDLINKIHVWRYTKTARLVEMIDFGVLFIFPIIKNMQLVSAKLILSFIETEM